MVINARFIDSQVWIISLSLSTTCLNSSASKFAKIKTLILIVCAVQLTWEVINPNHAVLFFSFLGIHVALHFFNKTR